MNVGDHHFMVERVRPELVLTTAAHGFIFGDDAVRKEECERRPADVINIFFLRNLAAPEKPGIKKTFEAAVNASVGSAGQRLDLFDAEETVIVNELENLEVVVGYDDTFAGSFPFSFCNSF
jgi:hypothetical protein